MWLFVIFLISLTYALIQIAVGRVKNQSKYMRNVPGKKPFLIFGNMLDFYSGSTVLLDTLMGYIKTYGNRVIIHDGMFSWALLSTDYELNELIYTSSVHLEKSKQYEFLHGWLGDGLLTTTGSKWKSHRKVITPSFHFSVLREYIEVFDRVGGNLIKKLENEAGKDSVEITHMISLYALDVICEATMGTKINALDEGNSTYVQSIKKMCKIFVDRTFSFLSPLVYQLTSNYYIEQKALKVIHKHVDDVISNRIEENQRKAKTGSLTDEDGVKKRLAFLDMLLEAKIDGKPLSREELRDEVNTFMFEGHDTTSTAVSFCLLMIATHPEVQEKIVAEQLEIFPSGLKNAHPTYKELSEMKYLDMVIKETLRVFPSVPFFGRKLSRDVDFNGTLYPKGLAVLLFPFGAHRNPKYFPDPEKFNPERFSNVTEKLPFAYAPFSAGPRNCIGQKFAVLEIMAIVSKIVRKFKLSPAKPEHRIQLAAEAVLLSKNGIKISLQHR